MTLVDFSVTFPGLEDQLLGKLILKVEDLPLTNFNFFAMLQSSSCPKNDALHRAALSLPFLRKTAYSASESLQPDVQEKTDLEEQRHALAKEVQAYRSKILQLEEDLLYRLSNSKVLLSPLSIHGCKGLLIHRHFAALCKAVTTPLCP